MPVVSVINYKGGVGKTTLTANLGAELAYRDYNVLLIDLDPQASLTFSFVKPDWWNQHLAAARTIKTWYDETQLGNSVDLASLAFAPRQVNAALRKYGPQKRVHLIPSHLGLINVDLELATGLGGANMTQAKQNYMRVHRRLAEGLGQAAFEAYDVILIDCPPNFNIVTKTAIVASDWVLIPAKADYLSTLGIDYLQRSLNELVHDFNEFAEVAPHNAPDPIAPQLLGVVFTMTKFYAGQPVAASRPYIAQARTLGVPVFDTHLRENPTLFAGAAEEGVPVVIADRSNYRGIRGELEEFVNEFITRLGI